MFEIRFDRLTCISGKMRKNKGKYERPLSLDNHIGKANACSQVRREKEPMKGRSRNLFWFVELNSSNEMINLVEHFVQTKQRIRNKIIETLISACKAQELNFTG